MSLRNRIFGDTPIGQQKMRNRIRQIMLREKLNQKDFSEITGISPATLSSIFNGRTSPTIKHAKALHECFPNLNMAWLMFGEGDMFVAPSEEGQEEAQTAVPSLFPDDDMDASYFGHTSSDENGRTGNVMGVSEGGTPASGVANGGTQVIREIVKFTDKPQRKIIEIRIFFDDGTFEVYPGK